ncbi:MAG: hypothetical protein AAB478_04700 [Patescibacteria group bacterium]
MRRIFAIFALTLGLTLGFAYSGPVSAASSSVCKIPNGGDADNNGIGDAGVRVVCNYTSVYAYDSSDAYYWDLGDGRIYTSAGITTIDDLDQDTLSVCDYQVHTKGSFNNDPYQDTGVISNMIRCSGFGGNATFNYQIVHSDDPRYTGNPDWAIWGDWEYHVLTESGSGNVVQTIVAHLNRPV